MSKSMVVEVTGKIPFAGRSIMKYIFQKGRESSRSGELTGKLTAAAALSTFALLHAVQMKTGIAELAHAGDHNPALVGIDTVFTSANAMASYSQAYLAMKVLATRSEVLQETYVQRPKARLDTTSIPMDLAFTLGGQALFMATMH